MLRMSAAFFENDLIFLLFSIHNLKIVTTPFVYCDFISSFRIIEMLKLAPIPIRFYTLTFIRCCGQFHFRATQNKHSQTALKGMIVEREEVTYIFKK